MQAMHPPASNPAPKKTAKQGKCTEKGIVDQPTLLIVSDDAEFPGAVTGRWQSERNTPAFTLMTGDLCQGLDADAFTLAIVGPVRPQGLPAVLRALEPSGKPVLLVCDDGTSVREVRELLPRVMILRQNEGWVEALVLVAGEVLRRCEAVERVRRADRANALLKQQATLGSYMLEMRHNLNNALTSVLGNSELLLLEPGSLSAMARSQIETIRNMALRMHEILQRFSSLEKELKVAARQPENLPRGKAQSAAHSQ
jgi:signal transduction histidine kinase